MKFTDLDDNHKRSLLLKCHVIMNACQLLAEYTETDLKKLTAHLTSEANRYLDLMSTDEINELVLGIETDWAEVNKSFIAEQKLEDN